MRKTSFEAILGPTGEPVDTGRIEDHLKIIADSPGVQDLSIAICTARIDESGPPLSALLERAADGSKLTDEEANLLFFGLYILGGARFTPAFQPLLRLLRLPEEENYELLGDLTTESMPRIAAGLFDGDALGLSAVIRDPQTGQFSRDALLGAATFLTWEGRISHDDMRQLLADVDAARPIPDGEIGWLGWVTAIALLGYRDLAPLVRQAFADGRIDETMMDLDEFDKLLGEAEAAPDDIERFKAEHLGYIENVVESLQWVARISEFEDKVFGADEPLESSFEESVESSLDELLNPHAPVINEWRHVGRNDPCPCGSGKKAKKCCL